MKVMCIRGNKPGDRSIGGYQKGYQISPEDMIFEGDFYTVASMRETEHGIGYILEERPKDILYNHSRFAVISDIDETEMQREYGELTVKSSIMAGIKVNRKQVQNQNA